MDHSNNLRIFLLDDDVFSLEIHRQYLATLGYHYVKTFTRGQDCIEWLKEQPDVVFLDYDMDAMNGLEVLKRIKAVDPDIFVVLYSGQQDRQATVNILKFGAFDYILKDKYGMERMKEVLTNIRQMRLLLEPHKMVHRSRQFSCYR